MKKILPILLTLPLCTIASFTSIGTLRAQQVTPDGTVSTTVTTPDGKIFNINDGTIRGGNLFHSFKEFSVPTGGSANFNNAADVRNIIGRVTGGSVSSIDGLIRTLNSANLFLLNPAGIIFGPNASLNIGGSFLGSTANSFVFGNGFEFSATDPQAPPLLTINVPIGLRFRDNPGNIVNQSQASLDGATNTFSSPAGLKYPAGLQVPNGKTLALVGGNVSLSAGNLTALGGRIELGSVDSDSFVSLNQINTGYALGYQNVQKLRDIGLSSGARVNTSGDGAGGDIQVQGKNITLTESSSIRSGSLSQAGGNLIINAAESVKLSGGSVIGTSADGEGKAGDVLVKAFDSVELEGTASALPTFLFSQVCGFSSECSTATGNGGNMTIETGKLLVRDGANIDTSTFGVGNAGNILIKASNSVDVIGTNNNPNNRILSGIRAQVGTNPLNNAGNAGNVTIETQRLTVQGGAQISTAGRKTGGNGGNLTINATDSILLSGTSPFATGEPLDTGRSGLFVSAEPGATGNVGSLKLTTGVLTVEGGARISADNFGSGSPGSSTLDVRQLVIQNGGEVKSGSFATGDGGTLIVNATESVDVIGSRTIAGKTLPSTLFSEASGAGKAGNLIINTPNLNVRNGGRVTVSATGTGAAGNLTANVNTIRLNRGKLTAQNNAGDGGNINLQNLGLLRMENQSLISAQAFNDANGGNITINAPNGFVVAFPGQNNDIVASAERGTGGNIDIKATNIFGLEQRKSTPINTTNDIDASSQFGSQGTVIINTLDVDPSRGLFELSENVIDPAQQIALNPCIKGFGSTFTVTGRGGLPTDPNKILSSDNVRVDLIQPVVNQKNSSSDTQNQSSSSAKAKPKVKEIIPARGWIFNEKGQVVLVGYDPTQTGIQRSQPTPPACPAF
ncbi:two-partner secretion domain-containing protein [Brasilonema octagenarum]|uniref:Filamentous hemagglutinin n=1 Tax=Brasilonema octagenarum UFV-OR1 TaxID=417115 RepID=A0ABX1LYM7_9CYAN|nr:filamentous hemagglutinin N-terminal domain-containing protein [Brasilonema octagenarum]NMF61308.1 filamentous hemagglutinin [Brasilonema octagenarum UFV-OR1]